MDVLPLGLVGDGALRAAAVADREVTRMEGVRLDHLVQYLGQVAADWEPPVWQGRGAEQAIRLGGPATPEIPEFAVVEVAAALGLTQPAATILCADVLDLAYRLPRLASAVRAGVLGFTRAQVIARRTRELSKEQAALVQERLCQPRDTSLGPAPVVAVVAMSRLRTVVDQAVITVRGPESQAEAEARVAASLFVQVSPSEPGAADVAARLEVTDAVRLDRRLDQIAGWLTQVGDSRPKAILRAVALGLLADPALLRALDDLRKQHEDTSVSPTATSGSSDVGESSDVGSDEPTPPTPTEAIEPPVMQPSAVEPPSDAQPDGTLSTGSPARLAEAAHHAPSDRAGHHETPSSRSRPAGQEDPGPAQEPVLTGALPPPAAAAIAAESEPDGGDSGDSSDRAGGAGGVSVAQEPLAGVAGCPPGLLEKFAGLTSTVLYLHLDQASGTWCEGRGGVLTPGQARAVVGHAKVSVRPVLNLAEPLSYTGYVAPPRLKEQLALLNAGYCPFPYCHRRARAGDVDHQVPYRQGGPTATPNTHLPCRKHHRAKDKAGWKVTTPNPGVWIWTSPAGAIYLVTNGTTTQLNGIGAGAGATAGGPSAAAPVALARQGGPIGGDSDGVRLGGVGDRVGAEHADDGSDGIGRSAAGADADAGAGDSRPVPDRRADTRAGTRSWAPSWDPWDDIDPLTLDEHDVTYGFINTA